MRGQLYRGHANATALSSCPVISALSSKSDDPGSSPGRAKALCPWDVRKKKKIILHRQQTFTYYAEYWNNTVAYNESAGTSLNEDETKLSSFWSTPFTRLCLGMKRPANGVTNWIALNYPASSLRDVIGDGTFRPTNLSVTEWKKLLNNSGIQVKSLFVEFPLLSQ